MGGFRRFILFVFSLAGIACLAALALPWFGLFPDQIAMLEGYDWYVTAVEVCLGMTAAWLFFELLRSLFSRRRREAISVMDVDGGAITVTKSAVASQAGHIVEALGVGTARSVDVSASRAGVVRVDVKVTPFESIDVTDEAPTLHEGLVAGVSEGYGEDPYANAVYGVAAGGGEHLGAVNVEFLEPQHASSLVTLEEDEESDEENAPAQGSGADDTGDITIPMNVEREA